MRRALWSIVLVGALGMSVGVGCGPAVKKYANQGQLEADPEFAAYVVLGKFGNHWPAKIARVDTARDAIELSLAGGAKHQYSGFAGYELKAVYLNAGGKETVVLFRSKEKL